MAHHVQLKESTIKNIFKRTGALNPQRSVFDLSYSKLFDCDMGQLIPVLCDECIPGDIWKLKNQVVVRCNPLVAPILHEVNAYVHYFFVPYRLLFDSNLYSSANSNAHPDTGSWVKFITGGTTGTDTSVLPRWPIHDGPAIATLTAEKTLWDYFGLPQLSANTLGVDPLAFPMRAYYLVFNEYYRDETLQTPLDITLYQGSNYGPLYRNWKKDYFTSALPWQQRGTAPALPISGTTTAVFPSHGATGSLGDPLRIWSNSGHTIYGIELATADEVAAWNLLQNDNTVSLSSMTFNVSDLRYMMQVQKWLERNARGGVRYTEFLREHFGVAPRDETLQRPVYIGGTKAPLIVSEVLQTSETATTAQGNMAGHAISVSENFAAKYRVEEFGLVLGLMSIMPEPMYQQGIDRQWLRQTKYDFPFAEFAHLSEQAITTEELYTTGISASDDVSIFGYQGRYDECRVKRNQVAGNMKTTFNYWHLGRIFSSKPSLNESFIQCNPAKRVFADQTDPGFIVHFANIVKCVRPLPANPTPGYVDHF